MVRAAAAPAKGPGVELVPLMLAVVAEKTGYPPDMVDLSMDLEADLGIDSIKRVEILSTVRERAPGLPELDPSALAPLRTLAQIVDFLETRLRGTAPAPAKNGASASTLAAHVRPAPPTAQIRTFVVERRPAPSVGLAMGGLFAGPILVTPPDDLTPQDLGSNDQQGLFNVTGFRVPVVVVSPWSRPQTISHLQTDYTSILKLIETRFNVPALTQRDATTQDMTDPTNGFFDFSTPHLLTVPPLPTQPTDGTCDFRLESSP